MHHTMCSFLNSYLKINLIDVVQSEQFNWTLIFLNGSVYTAQFLCLILIGLLKVDSKIHLPIPEFFWLSLCVVHQYYYR